MNEVLNGELHIALPEGFRVMTADELKRIYSTAIKTICGFWDEERHVIFVITWNVTNKLLVRIASTKDVVKRVERAQSRALKGSGYHKDGFFDTIVAGEAGRGVRFGYSAEGVAHDAEAIVFVHGATCYTIYCYGRTQNAQLDAPLRQEVLGSLAFGSNA